MARKEEMPGRAPELATDVAQDLQLFPARHVIGAQGDHRGDRKTDAQIQHERDGDAGHREVQPAMPEGIQSVLRRGQRHHAGTERHMPHIQRNPEEAGNDRGQTQQIAQHDTVAPRRGVALDPTRHALHVAQTQRVAHGMLDDRLRDAVEHDEVLDPAASQCADPQQHTGEGGEQQNQCKMFRACHFSLPNYPSSRAVRKRLPDAISLMVDFNQALSVGNAMQYCPALDNEGVYWIEEPIKHDDFLHASMISNATRTPIQLGENFVGLAPVLDALKANATDFLMLDLDRIGGVSGWRFACGLAAAAGREVSSHLFPEVSAHLLAATPTRHWLEYVDWANPILEEPLLLQDGKAMIQPTPGNGVRWDETAVATYRLS